MNQIQTHNPSEPVELRLRLPYETAEAVTSCCARLSVRPSQFINLCVWEALHSMAEIEPVPDVFDFEPEFGCGRLVLAVTGNVGIAAGTTCRVAE